MVTGGEDYDFCLGAAVQGVSCQVHPLGALAAGVIGLSEEAIAMRRESLPQFLDGWSPYELTLADMPGSPDTGRTDEIALAIGTTAYYDEPVLPGLPGSCLLYSGHDDCYLHVESTCEAVPPALLSACSPCWPDRRWPIASRLRYPSHLLR